MVLFLKKYSKPNLYSIQTIIFLIILTFILLIVLTLSIYNIISTKNILMNDFNKWSKQIAINFASDSFEGISIEDNKSLYDSLNRVFEESEITYAAQFSNTGIKLAEKSRSPEDKLAGNLPKTVKKAEIKNDNKILNIYYPVFDKNGEYSGFVVVNVSLEKINKEITNSIILSISSILVFAAVGVFVSFFIARKVSKPIKTSENYLEKLSLGDYTIEMPLKMVQRKDEFGSLSRAIQTMQQRTKDLISDIANSSNNVLAKTSEVATFVEQVKLAAEQIAVSVAELSEGYVAQATNTENGSIQLNGIIRKLDDINSELNKLESFSEKTKEMALEGDKSVKSQEEIMSESVQISENIKNSIDMLSEKTKKISQVANIIKEIANKTNLLSLNAAIEAARAGIYGRGFAVVATEIKALSDKTSQSIKNIDEITREVQEQLSKVISEIDLTRKTLGDQDRTMNNTNVVFMEILKSINTFSQVTKTITSNSNELNTNAFVVGDMITSVASFTEEASAGAEEIAASTQEQTSLVCIISKEMDDLNSVADGLKRSISKFKL